MHKVTVNVTLQNVCFAGIVALRKGVESVHVRRLAFLRMPLKDVGSLFDLVHECFEELQRAVLADYHHPTTRQLQGRVQGERLSGFG